MDSVSLETLYLSEKQTEPSESVKVAGGVLECLGAKWKDGQFCDLKVTVDNKTFHCHRFILSACSDFFDGLLRSDMRENRTGEVRVNGVRAEIFALLLDGIYTGQMIYTINNMTDIWHAANQLQIPFLIQASEEFVMKSMSLQNALTSYQHAKLLNSKLVMDKCRQLMHNNMSTFYKLNDFLELSFEDFLAIVTYNKEDDARKRSKNSKWKSRKHPQIRQRPLDAPWKYSYSVRGECNILESDLADVKIKAILRWVTMGRHQASSPSNYNSCHRGNPFLRGHQMNETALVTVFSRGREDPREHASKLFNNDTDSDSEDDEVSEFVPTKVPSSCSTSLAEATSTSEKPEAEEREKYLGPLLEGVGLSKISGRCLAELLRDDLVLRQLRVLSVVTAAVAERL